MRYTDRDYIFNTASQKLLNQIEHHKDIFILSNSTVDGLVSSAMLLSSIHNSNGNATIRSFNSSKLKDFKTELMRVVNEKHDFYVFLDFESHFYFLCHHPFAIYTDLQCFPFYLVLYLDPWYVDLN